MANPTTSAVDTPDAEAVARLSYRRALARKKRKEREAAGRSRS